MNDLINRSALGVGYANPLVFDNPEFAKGWNAAIEIIAKVPAVDAVEVVRCGECEKRKTTECALSYFVFDDFDVEVRFLDVPDDFYCPYGERRTE